MSEIDFYLKHNIETRGKGDELHTVWIRFNPIALMVQEMLSHEYRHSIILPDFDNTLENELTCKIRGKLFEMLEEDVKEHPMNYPKKARVLFGMD